MLTKWAAALFLLGATLGLSTAPAGAAMLAEGDRSTVECSGNRGTCFIEVERPGSSGGRGSSARGGAASGSGAASEGGASSGVGAADPGMCRDEMRNIDIPCHDPNRGWWDVTTNCYHLRAEPQPPVGDAIWQGHTDGAIYVEICPHLQGAGGLVWRPDPPAGSTEPTLTPAELAERAIERLGDMVVELAGRKR